MLLDEVRDIVSKYPITVCVIILCGSILMAIF